MTALKGFAAVGVAMKNQGEFVQCPFETVRIRLGFYIVPIADH